MSETKTLTARCHCGSTHFTLTLPTSALPLKVHLCHCTICRTVHGAPAAFHAPLPSGVQPEFISPSEWDKLTPYTHTNANSYRYFCSTCGCHIGDRSLDMKTWTISVSIFDENANDGIWVFNDHIYTSSTGDGGLAALLPKIDGREIKAWDTEAGNKPAMIAEEPSRDIKDDTLVAQCHCGGVSFNISRPRKVYLDSPSSKGWVHPSDSTKWLATFDTCSDCRLVTGAHVIAWLFVPIDHISPALPDDLLIGTAKSYRSSKRVHRTFCGTCGATVFFSEDTRPGIVDVATGILHARDGFMLRDWAIWRTERLGYHNDGLKYDKVFTQSLAEQLHEWGKQTHGEARDFVVGTETSSASE
ncbi:hypothetical protein BDV12DRAFT_176857 [Aspergillus spectabilis]